MPNNNGIDGKIKHDLGIVKRQLKLLDGEILFKREFVIENTFIICLPTR